MTDRKIVLIVDDDMALLDVLALSFSFIGNISVEKASSGAEGIKKAVEINPDLIVMDYKMPGMNGWDAAKCIKDNEETNHIPIIGYTAWAGKEDIRRGIQIGLSEIITKPMDIDNWEQKIAKYLN